MMMIYKRRGFTVQERMDSTWPAFDSLTGRHFLYVCLSSYHSFPQFVSIVT